MLAASITIALYSLVHPAGLAAPSQQPPPNPPPPAVVFVSETKGASASAGRVAKEWDESDRALQHQNTPAHRPSAEGSVHRGALVARTREVSDLHDVHVPLVTAEGLKVCVSEALALSLPLLARPSFQTPPPLADEEYEAPVEVEEVDLGPNRPLPPSPGTVVTYYALDGEDARVRTMPYLSLVEKLIGKQAYAVAVRRSGTPATTATPTRGRGRRGRQRVTSTATSPTPAPVYGGPPGVTS